MGSSSGITKGAIIVTISGVVGGIFLGCGLAIILEMSDTTIRTREQLQGLTGIEVISRIPLISSNHYLPADFSINSKSGSTKEILKGDAI